jgi:DNA-binding MarR family transcriptional regulator
MSQSRLMLLRELMRMGEMSQAELVQRLGMEGTLVTRFVKHMEGAGLLTRRSDPRDNRFTLVILTSAGEQIAQQMAAFTHMLEAQLLEGLSEEVRATIREGLEQIQEKYEHLLLSDAPTNPPSDDVHPGKE